MWARNGRWILPEMPDFHVAFSNLLHSVNLRHGTDGFISPPKEGVLRIFSPWKIRRLRPGLNPRTWVPKASTLPLDHRSRLCGILCIIHLLEIILADTETRVFQDHQQCTTSYLIELEIIKFMTVIINHGVGRREVGSQGLLIIKASRSKATAHSVGLLWTSDQPDAETSTWQHTTLTTDGHLCTRRDSKTQPQQASCRRPTS